MIVLGRCAQRVDCFEKDHHGSVFVRFHGGVCLSCLFLQHGEIIESSYLLGEKGPKSTWTKVLEMVILLATVGGCAYLFVFLFHHGNHHPAPAKDSASHPQPPVGASSSVGAISSAGASSADPASCNNYTKCSGKRGGIFWGACSLLHGWGCVVCGAGSGYVASGLSASLVRLHDVVAGVSMYDGALICSGDQSFVWLETTRLRFALRFVPTRSV